MINSVCSGQMSQMMPRGMQAKPPSAEDAAASLIEKADSNSDGLVDKAELVSFLETATSANESTSVEELADKMLSDFDADGDGAITQNEASTAINDLASAMRQQVQGMMSPPPNGGPPPMDAAAMFSEADTDESGGLDETEFGAMLENGPMGSSVSSEIISSLFSESDTDGDGILTEEELQTAMETRNHGSHEVADNSDSDEDASTTSASDELNPLIAQLLRYYQMQDDTTVTEISEVA